MFRARDKRSSTTWTCYSPYERGYATTSEEHYIRHLCVFRAVPSCALVVPRKKCEWCSILHEFFLSRPCVSYTASLLALLVVSEERQIYTRSIHSPNFKVTRLSAVLPFFFSYRLFFWTEFGSFQSGSNPDASEKPEMYSVLPLRQRRPSFCGQKATRMSFLD